jgi:dihydrofolate synthase/folylpolyglutamate synthase
MAWRHLPKIAAEKAGIIKPGVPVVTTECGVEALRVIERVARENNAPLTRAVVAPSALRPPPAALVGEHQRANAALAVTVAEVLRKTIPVRLEQIHAGLAQVKWPGRLQLITRPNGQRILLDGAHNIAGVETLCAALEAGEWRDDPGSAAPTIILGMLGDKDWRGMCARLAPRAARLLLVPVDSQRSARPEELAVACRAANPHADVRCFDKLEQALAAAAGDKLVVIAGSLYLIGAALALLDPTFHETEDERALNEWGSRPKAASPR